MTLHHKIYGSEKPVLIVLHGLFGMLDNWHKMANKWSENFTVISVDQRNHGKSFHSSEMTYELMADDVIDLMDQLEIEKAHILGHSMGGKTVMTLLKYHSDRCTKAIIVDIAPKEYKGGHELFFETLSGIDFSQIRSRREAEEMLASKIENTGIRLFLLKNLVKGIEGYGLKMNLPVIWSFYNELKGHIDFPFPISTPTLFIGGGDSDYILEDDLDEISDHFLDVRYEQILDAGHWVHADQPEALKETVTNYLQE